jgi:hypothetical protein
MRERVIHLRARQSRIAEIDTSKTVNLYVDQTLCNKFIWLPSLSKSVAVNPGDRTGIIKITIDQWHSTAHENFAASGLPWTHR